VQGCAERQLHRFVSQEFHRPGGFDGVWPMTLAPELAKLKGFLDATVEFQKENAYGKSNS